MLRPNQILDIYVRFVLSYTLPENVVNAPSLNAFKSRLNKHWYWHPNKFEAKCYQVGSTDPNTRVETHRNAPEEV